MARVIKWLFYLIVLAVLGLIGYAYGAEFFDISFRPDVIEIHQPVTLDAN